VLEQDPFSGHLFAFLNRRRDKVKILCWDRAGFVLLYNQPSSHYTCSGLL
jgi:transposase